MSSEQKRLKQLLSLARKSVVPAIPHIDEIPPPGFATRVAARWSPVPPRKVLVDGFERLCWWGSGVAAVFCLTAFLARAHTPAPTGFDVLLETPMTEASPL